MSARSEELEYRLRRGENGLWPQTSDAITPLVWAEVISTTDEQLQELESLANSLDGSTAHVVALGPTAWLSKAFSDLNLDESNGRAVKVVPDTHPDRLAAIDTTDSDFIIVSPSSVDQGSEAVFDWLLSRVNSRSRYLVIADPDSSIYQRAKEIGIRRLIPTQGKIREPWRALGSEGLITPALLGYSLHSVLEGARFGLVDRDLAPKVDELAESLSYVYDLEIASAGLRRWCDTLLATALIDPHLHKISPTPGPAAQFPLPHSSSKKTLELLGSSISRTQLTVALVAAVRSINPFDPTYELSYDAELRKRLQQSREQPVPRLSVEELIERLSRSEPSERHVRFVEFTANSFTDALASQSNPDTYHELPLLGPSIHGPSALRSFGELWAESTTRLHFVLALHDAPMESIQLRSQSFSFQELYRTSIQLFAESFRPTDHMVYAAQM